MGDPLAAWAPQYAELLRKARADARVLVRVERVPGARLREELGAATTATTASSPWTRALDDARVCAAVVTLDDASTLNALTPSLMVQLRDRVEELVNDPDVKAVVVTGAPPAFCSGGHLDMIRAGADAVHSTLLDASLPGSGTAEPWRFIRLQFGGLVRLIANANAVFVAAVKGPAAGVGLAIALACDACVAAKHGAKFVPAFGRLGLVPEVGTSWLVTRRLGYQNAFRFFTDGAPLDADRALKLGLVQEVVPDRELAGAARAWCARALCAPAHTLEFTKTLLRAVADLPFEPAMRMEEFAEANCFSARALPVEAERVRTATSRSSERAKM